MGPLLWSPCCIYLDPMLCEVALHHHQPVEADSLGNAHTPGADVYCKSRRTASVLTLLHCPRKSRKLYWSPVQKTVTLRPKTSSHQSTCRNSRNT